MAAQWYKNGSHDSWESTQCPEVPQLWLTPSVEGQTLRIEASVFVAHAVASKSIYFALMFWINVLSNTIISKLPTVVLGVATILPNVILKNI